MNAKQQFTPGPWIQSGCTVRSEFSPRFVATVGAPSDRGDTDLANARLIAAAPELYAALRDMVHTAKSYWTLRCPSTQWPALDSARAALAKVQP